MLRSFLAVALGGAVGAMARYGVSVLTVRVIGHGFPLATMIVNVVGSFVMGALIEALALRWTVPPEVRLFLIAGFLGAFTTFSTFTLDVVALADRGQVVASTLYLGLSVALGLGALVAGMALGRMAFQGS
ncbi:fluoride efflux transporter CrcB [Pararhodospirillum oryzae]|uniref:Fluoride-specific ion channel FluC n=1 Tax=Pararhodospirillum oryzae TaxID=478448 RepID=A0A512H9S7_9PROT|nr:fluoride efflux transporter CrcB [Pararhodospirillum oryzae]GEO82188.1 putative fluoride ion transporter CrcB [Pararhodospirillum oryzae]